MSTGGNGVAEKRRYGIERQKQQQQQSFYGPFSGTSRISRYQKKHSHTHQPDHHPIFISFFHLPRSIASSLFKLRAWQPFLHNLSPPRLWSTSWWYRNECIIIIIIIIRDSDVPVHTLDSGDVGVWRRTADYTSYTCLSPGPSPRLEHVDPEFHRPSAITHVCTARQQLLKGLRWNYHGN